MKLKTIFFYFAVLTLLTAATGLYFFYDAQKTAAFNEDRLISISHANSIKNSFSQLIVRYQRTALSLSRHPELTLSLTQPSTENLNSTNRILDTYNSSMKTSVCYLINRDGITIASSNRNDLDSFVGNNYSFRPYFRNAVQGETVVYMAQGATSGKRGIYFSNPVYGKAGAVKGVVVIKENIEELKDDIFSRHYPTHVKHIDFVFIINEDGLIFISDRPDMILHTFWETDKSSIDRIASSKQFGPGPWPWAGFKKIDQGTVIDQAGTKYHFIMKDIEALSGWKIVHLSDADAITKRIVSSLFGAAGYLLIFIFMVLFFVLIMLIFQAAKAEKSISESEKRFKSLFNSINEGICLHEIVYHDNTPVDYRILEINPVFEKITGLKSKDAIGSLASELYGLGEAPYLDTYYDVVANNKPTSFETYFAPFDKHFRISVFSPGAHQFATVFQDITEQKRFVKELEKTKELLEDTQAIAKLGGWEYIVETNELIWTKETFRIHGIEKVKNPVDLDKAISFYDSEHSRLIKKLFQKALDDGKPYDVELQINRTDGKKIWVKTRAKPILEKDAVVRIKGNILDITDRKKVEQEREFLYTALENSLNGFDIVSEEGKFIYVNNAYARMWGYEDPQELIGTSPVSHCDDPTIPEQIIKRLKQSSSYELEFIAKRKDGSTFDVLMRAELMHDDKGNELYLGTSMDLSERKRAEEEKKALESQLQQAQKIESIGTLAGGIAHDFNNILYPIVGMSELLLEDLPPDSNERENAEEIFKAGKRGSDLVKQILAFSRQSEHKMMPTQIQNVLKEVIKLSRSTIPTYIKIEQDIQQNCGMVMADPSQIHQIGMNIITNAYHAIEDTGGKISIKLNQTVIDSSDSFGINIGQGEYAVLSISDTGHGMSKELIGKIFDPYFTTKKQGKGTGLGLAVVYGIVKEHGGDIKVYSEIGKGSTFEIYLPLMKKNTGTDSIPEAEDYQGGNERVLLVDDEEPIAKLEKQMLERMGYKVTSRLHSIEALEAFKASPSTFDLVITDMSMPNIPGDELARKIKSIRADVPIIICTGFSERISEENFEQMGIDGLLMKPVVKSELAKTTRRVLDKAQSKI